MPDVPEGDDISVHVETCDEDDPADRLDVTILARAPGPGIRVHDCDSAYEREEEFTYVDPSEHKVETVTGTVPASIP